MAAQTENFALIRVVGVGGAGSNAVNRMIRAELLGVEFIAVSFVCTSADVERVAAVVGARARLVSKIETQAALDARVPIGLGADWMPSGSLSLLHELKIAERCLAIQGCDVGPERLVAMVTSDAAARSVVGT